MIEPLRLSLTLRCSAEHAFSTWTQRIATWWPRSHSVSGDPELSVVLEGRLGGRIFERTSDGTELDWGEITLWEPPRQFGYLWHMRTDRSSATDVRVTFVDLANGECRVDIEHSGWDRLGDGGQAWRDRNLAGWSGLLPHLVAACE